MTRKMFCLLAVLGLMTLGAAEIMAGAQSEAQSGRGQ